MIIYIAYDVGEYVQQNKNKNYNKEEHSKILQNLSSVYYNKTFEEENNATLFNLETE